VLALTPATRIYLAAGATDMRKSFDTLAAIVTNELTGDLLSGHLFVFCNAGRNRLKVMYWDGSGLWVSAKRLEKGTFAWPKCDGPSCELTREQLMMLIAGVDLQQTRARRWYRVEKTAGFVRKAS